MNFSSNLIDEDNIFIRTNVWKGDIAMRQMIKDMIDRIDDYELLMLIYEVIHNLVLKKEKGE